MPHQLVQFCCLWKLYSCLLTPNCKRNHVITYTSTISQRIKGNVETGLGWAPNFQYKDKNWVVSRQEFRNIIRSWRIPLTDVDLEDLILALDRDNSDALDYRELAVGRQSYLEERWAYMYNILFRFANLKYFLWLISRAVTIFWV